MGDAFVPGLQLSKCTLIRRRRELPVRGEILVRLGDTVSSSTTVAQALLPGELHVLRIAEKMGIDAREAIQALKVKEGDNVEAGSLLCEYSGLFGLLKNKFHSSVSGQVEFITPRTGHLGVRTSPKRIALDAYITGKIIELDQGKAVNIEASVGFMQGIFGIGGERQGILRVLDIALSEQLSEKKIPDNALDGKILVGGNNPSSAALKKACALGAVGLITGSIDDEALADYLGYNLGIALTGDEEVPMSLIISEGFGRIPMSKKVYELLKLYDGSSASINGATQVRAGAVRPEVIIFAKELQRSSTDDQKAHGLDIGRQIRIIREPYFGSFATVTELPLANEEIPSGAICRILRAKLEDGREVSVPRANVELVL